jgi:hypothetical protein
MAASAVAPSAASTTTVAVSSFVEVHLVADAADAVVSHVHVSR